jgi:hypothetical protein
MTASKLGAKRIMERIDWLLSALQHCGKAVLVSHQTLVGISANEMDMAQPVNCYRWRILLESGRQSFLGTEYSVFRTQYASGC